MKSKPSFCESSSFSTALMFSMPRASSRPAVIMASSRSTVEPMGSCSAPGRSRLASWSLAGAKVAALSALGEMGREPQSGSSWLRSCCSELATGEAAAPGAGAGQPLMLRWSLPSAASPWRPMTRETQLSNAYLKRQGTVVVVVVVVGVVGRAEEGEGTHSGGGGGGGGVERRGGREVGSALGAQRVTTQRAREGREHDGAHGAELRTGTRHNELLLARVGRRQQRVVLRGQLAVEDAVQPRLRRRRRAQRALLGHHGLHVVRAGRHDALRFEVELEDPEDLDHIVHLELTLLGLVVQLHLVGLRPGAGAEGLGARA